MSLLFWNELLVYEAWRQDYDAQKPHSALGYLSPIEFIDDQKKNKAA